jgi:hypothetical protein
MCKKYNFFDFSIEVKDDCDYNEIVFLNIMEQSLGEGYTLHKTLHPFCNVDYRLDYEGIVVGFIELKVRESLKNYSSIKIGEVKLNVISQHYRKTIFVWLCLDTNKLYFCKYSDDLLLCNKNRNTYEIDKKLCSVGLNELVNVCRDW